MASLYGFGQSTPGTSPRDPTGRRSRDGRRVAGESLGPEPQGNLPEERSISSLIEGEIIPRLMVAHPSHDFIARPPRAGDTSAITAADVAGFAPLSLQVEADELLDHVEGILARGVSVDSLLVDLLAPTARLLGDWWTDDRADFFDVTMGLWRLQEVVHELSARAPAARQVPTPWRHALFAPMPGDQHGFGTLVLDEVFAREGWTTERLTDPRAGDLIERVTGDWFDLVGLTVSCDYHIGALPSVIAAVRSASRNPQLRVMVGGPVFVGDATLATRVGADGTARDARVAVAVAEALVDAVGGINRSQD